MSEDELIPELHDVGKLLDNEALGAAIPGWPSEQGGHCFTDSARNPIALADLRLPQPSGLSWYGVVNHHERIPPQAEITDPNVKAWRNSPEVYAAAPELILLKAADHLAASTSRATKQEGGGPGDPWPELKSAIRQRLWSLGRAPRQPSLLTTGAELCELLDLLNEQPPDLRRFLERYRESLDNVPEDKGFPRSVTTLRAHLDLVGRYYRTLRRFSDVRHPGGRPLMEYAGQSARSCKDVEQNWRFRLARCRIRLPAIPARLRDLGVFQRLEAALDQIQADPDRRDHLLLATLQDLLLVLPVEGARTLRNVVQPLLDAGFEVEARVREAPLGVLTDWDKPGLVTSHYLQSNDLPAQIIPSLCEVCQLAQGKLWQKRPDDVSEYLCITCTETREKYSQRFERLEGWGTGYAVWLRVFLDFGALDEHLRDLFRQYIATKAKGIVDAAAQKQFVENLRTTALSVDYVNDFLAMQQDLADQLQALYPPDDMEALTSRRKELILLRLDDRRQILHLLQLFHVIASRHFSGSIQQPPFRLAVSAGPVRFPFGEHWRLLQKAGDDITVFLIGAGRLACSLAAVPEVISLAREQRHPRRGLHRLADIAAQSSALAQVALKDRAERDLAGIASRLHDLGLDFQSMAVLSRLSKE